MSGIFGIYYRSGQSVDHRDLERLSSSLKRRGRDDHGLWVGGSVGLGHRMLQSTPESVHEKLPYRDDEAGLVITADARIDNRDELAAALGISQHNRKEIPDSRLILAAYKKWGTECPRHLLGDFSFAIRDEKQQQLFCAIDHFGIRPFCYHLENNRFIFASDIQGLCESNLTSHVLDESRLISLFIDPLPVVDGDGTLYKNTFYLPPAHRLTINKKSIHIGAYWSADEITEIKLGSDEEYKAGFNEALQASVRCRLRSQGTTALALSGGIDSASLAAVSQDILSATQGKQVLYSGIGSDDRDCIETRCIRSAQSAFGQDAVTFTPDIVTENLPQLLTILNTYHAPLGIMDIFLLCLYQRTHQDGRHVMLDGGEADIVLGLGPAYIGLLLKRGRIMAAMREAFQYNSHSYAGTANPLHFIKTGLTSVLRPHIPAGLLSLYRRRSNRPTNTSCLPLKESFAAQITAQTSPRAVFKARGQHQSQALPDSALSLQARQIKHPASGRMYLGLDMYASQFALELRHPYMDKRLVEFALGMPMRFKNYHGWEKWILRDSIPHVPSDIRWRNAKTHVGWRFLDQLRKSIADELAHAIHDTDSPIYNYVDYPAMRRLYDQYKSRYKSGEEEIRSNCMLSFFGIYCWLKRYG